LVETAKKNLRLPVVLGANKHVATLIEKVNDLEYLTALGLTAWGEQFGRLDSRGGAWPLASVSGGTKEVFKKIISLFKP